MRGTLPNTFLLCAVQANTFAVAYGLVPAVVQFQTVEVVVTAESLAVHHAPEIQVYTLVGVGGNVAAVVSEEEAETGVEVLVAVGRTAGCHVVGLFDEMLGRVAYLVVVDVYLRAGKDVAFSQAEQEPRVDLYAAVTVFAGTVASDVIFVRAVTDAVEVVFRILVDKLSEDAEAVAFKEELRLYHQVDAAFEHIGYGHGSTERNCVVSLDSYGKSSARFRLSVRRNRAYSWGRPICYNGNFCGLPFVCAIPLVSAGVVSLVAVTVCSCAETVVSISIRVNILSMYFLISYEYGCKEKLFYLNWFLNRIDNKI